MATDYLDPNADISANWGETPAGTAFHNLDDAVRYSTTPNTSDYIFSSTNAVVCELDFPTWTKVGTVQRVKLWAYGKVGNASNQSITVELTDGTSSLGSATINSTTAAWWEVDYVGDLTQTQIDGLTAKFTHNEPTSDASNSFVYATYIEITSTSGSWPEALTLDPNQDVSANWGESPSGNAFGRLADFVRQPTAPGTTDDFLTSSTAAVVCEVGFTTFTKADTIGTVKLWAYCARGHATNQSITVELTDGASTLASTTDPGTTPGWVSATYTGDLSQAQINSLTAKFTHNEPTPDASNSKVYAAYIEIAYGSGSAVHLDHAGGVYHYHGF